MRRLVAPILASLFVTVAAAAQTAMPHDASMTSHDASAHDRMFADSMTRHHQDGIRMAQMAVQKAQNSDLRTMAQRMVDEQALDIGEMQSLRGDGPQTTMDEMQTMPGMMSESQMQADMARLDAAQGADFDATFTEIMPKHHQGAITMAKHELGMGLNMGLKAIARRIIEGQAKERTQLLAMHRDIVRGMPGTMTSSSSDHARMSKD